MTTRDIQTVLESVRTRLSPLLGKGVELQFDRDRGIEAYVGDGDPINLSTILGDLHRYMEEASVWIDASAARVNVCDDEGEVVWSTVESPSGMPGIVDKYIPKPKKAAI